MTTNYSLNEEALRFIVQIEKDIETGNVFTTKELVEWFHKSLYYNNILETYYKTAVSKAIWYAVRRSGNWAMNKGKYTKL